MPESPRCKECDYYQDLLEKKDMRFNLVQSNVELFMTKHKLLIQRYWNTDLGPNFNC